MSTVPTTARRAGAVIVAALACASTAQAAGATAPERALSASLERLVSAPGGPPGAIAVVQRGSRVSVYRAGAARPGGPAPRPSDRMRIASASKALTGAVVLALVRRGLLSTDDTIGARLPGLPRAWHRVTVAQLMRHTSGVPDYIANPEAQRAVGESLARAPRPRELLRFVEDRPLDFAPGSRYRYSNSDNVILGLMAEAVTGDRFEVVLARVVTRPLRLRDTGLPRGTALGRPPLRGYALDPPGSPDDVTHVLAGGWGWTAGGMISTPADLNRFMRAYVAGALTDPATRAAQRATVAGSSEPPGPGTIRTGLSIFRYDTRCGVVWGHTGNTLGYTQFAAASPDGRRSVVVTVNAQISPRTAPVLFQRLRAAYGWGACAALR